MKRIRSLFTWKRLILTGVVGGSTALLSLQMIPKYFENANSKKIQDRTKTLGLTDMCDNLPQKHLPTRDEQQASLREDEFDVLVVGGGATGCGVTLDAVSRGLKTAMVEKFDFASGTSSRSTKLLHGGVRYLQKAIMNLDKEQYKMVEEALSERANLIEIAPHLAYPLRIMLPIYKYWQIPYYWVGIKAYDVVAGTETLKSSYLLSKHKALELFPMLKRDKLKAALVYYDGQHEDARMCIAIALTAARRGATISNHTELIKVHKTKNADGKEVVSGARVRDRFTGEEWDIKAKCVVNATGSYTDFIRTMDDKKTTKICQPSSGVHIVLPDYYSPESMGLLDPQTSDGRVIFFLPWQGSTMAGTTDSPCSVTDNPAPTEEEIQFILKEIRNYLSPDVNVRRGDVLSAWSGIRPLVRNPNAKDTQAIARNHIIEVSDSNLVTIAGGKWTTYRSMAEETVDKAIEVCGLEPKNKCVTRGLLVEGADNWSPTLFIRLIQDFGIDSQVAQHLSSTYGDRAVKVAKLANLTGHRWPVVGKRLHPEFPYLEAEVIYAVREYACTAIDIIARRTRLAFLNVVAAEEALPRIIEIMGHELNWDDERKQEEHKRAIRFLKLEMGRNLKTQAENNAPVNFTKDEITTYMNRFYALDYDKKGYITLKDLRTYFKTSGEHVTEEQLHNMLTETSGEHVTEEQLHNMLTEVDTNKNGQIDMSEFLQLMSGLKTGAVAGSRLAIAAKEAEKTQAQSRHNKKVALERSAASGGI